MKNNRYGNQYKADTLQTYNVQYVISSLYRDGLTKMWNKYLFGDGASYQNKKRSFLKDWAMYDPCLPYIVANICNTTNEGDGYHPSDFQNEPLYVYFETNG